MRIQSIPRYCLVAVCLLGASLATQASDIYWQGFSGGGFNSSGNWSPASVPGPNDSAIFTNFTSLYAGVTWSADATNANASFLGSSLNYTPYLIAGANNWIVTNLFLVDLSANVFGSPIWNSGELYVTNSAGTAQMLIAPTGYGTMYLAGSGTITVDNLVSTNSLSTTGFWFQQGTLNTLHGSYITRPSDLQITIGAAGNSSTWNILGGTNLLLTVNGVSIAQAGGTTGIVNVVGPTTVWSNSANMTVAANGLGYLTITNGARVYGSSTVIGGTPAATGQVLITGSNSTWTTVGNGLYFYLGGNSSGGPDSNTLTIADGGRLNTTGTGLALILGAGSLSQDNLLLITGQGSTWDAGANTINVGGSAPGNQLKVEAAGQILAGNIVVGQSAAASNSVMRVEGTNSLVTLSGYLQAGGGSSSNLVIISGGGRIDSVGSSYVGSSSVVSNNVMLVTDPGSVWSNAGPIWVANQSHFSSLIISNGGAVYDTEGRVGGNVFSSNNSAIITGTNSLWENSSDLHVGRQLSDTNQLIVADGGTVRSVGGYVGRWDADGNSVLVTGSGSVWTNAGSLVVGDQSSQNRMIIEDGGKVFSGTPTLGSWIGADSNRVVVSGTGSEWNVFVPSSFLIGGNQDASGTGGGSFNEMIVTNGGQVIVATTYLALGNGATSTANRVVVTGPGSLWDTGASIIRVGQGGASNELIIADGGEVRGANTYVGGSASSQGNRILISNGGVLQVDDIITGFGGSTGTVTNDGGVYQFQRFNPGITTNGGAVTLNNGVISFLGINNADVQGSKSGSLTPISFSGNNTFRLNASSNTTSGQTYTFDTGLGPTNYYRLELINGATAYRGGNITIGGGGSMLASNTQTTITGVFSNSGGQVAFVNSLGTFQSAVVNSGGWTLDPSTNVFLAGYTVASGGSIQAGPQDLLEFRGDFLNRSTQSNTFDTVASRYLFSGGGPTQEFATAGKDYGPPSPGITEPLPLTLALPYFSNNFAIGTLELSNFSTVRVTDAFIGGTDDGLRAGVYVNDLLLGTSSLLIIDTNVTIYFVSSNNWASVGAGYLLLGDAELHQLVPEPSLLLLLALGSVVVVGRRFRRNRS